MMAATPYLACTLCLLQIPFVVGFPDWLVVDFKQPTQLHKEPDGRLLLTNGLISRTFLRQPGFATVDYYSHEKQSSLLRAIGPEAVIAIDGVTYNVGGILSDIPRAYLNRTALALDSRYDPTSFLMYDYQVSTPEAPYPYTPRRGAPEDISWPPKGLRLSVYFKAPFWAPLQHKNVTVVINYEMYDGIPLMTKSMTITKDKSVAEKLQVSILSVEYLNLNWQWSRAGYDWFIVENDWPHGTKVAWGQDPLKPKMPGSFEPTVNCTFDPIPSITIGQGIETFRVLEMALGSPDPERVALARHRMMRLLAPQTWENPLYFHTTTSKSTKVRAIIDQISATGFEMLVYSFGSGIKIESDDEKYMQRIAADVAYANQRGIEVGAYDLICMDRTVREEWMAINQLHYRAPCFASGWYDFLTYHVHNFFNKTGIVALAADGPYHGDYCASTNHSHHENALDSTYMQTKLQGEFFKTLRSKNMFINQPDEFFYQGGNRKNIGYNENQYSLPRWQDLSISRQGLFDDTFQFAPTAGWMFLPISVYHAGGEAASFEPLSKHQLEYDWALAQYMTSGVGVVYRGDELYDSPAVLEIVKNWVDFYKEYRDILRTDLIHVRRADMQSVDSFIHVNPYSTRRGLAMVMNPTNDPQTFNLTLPLYYTGLTETAYISERGAANETKTFTLARDYSIELGINLKPLTYTWYLITDKV